MISRLKQLTLQTIKKDRSNTKLVELAAKHIEYVQVTLMDLELKQIAESIQRVLYKRPITKESKSTLPWISRHKGKSLNAGKKSPEDKFEYMLIFDQSLLLDPIWLDYSTIKLLNSLRDDVAVSSIYEMMKSQPTGQKSSPPRRSANTPKPILSENENEFGYCHHCKQRKARSILATCNYSSELHGSAIPSSKTINNFTVYNIDVFTMAEQPKYSSKPKFMTKGSSRF